MGPAGSDRMDSGRFVLWVVFGGNEAPGDEQTCGVGFGSGVAGAGVLEDPRCEVGARRRRRLF